MLVDVVHNYELVELTDSREDDPTLRLRAESVAVPSWRFVCSCIILSRVRYVCCGGWTW